MSLLTVSRAGGLRFLEGPEHDVCGQVPATGGDDGQLKSQPGVQSGATRPPLHQGKPPAMISPVGGKNPDGDVKTIRW